jgi:hypothetical protein
MQVPRSSKHVTEDQDYVLMSVVLFRRVVDDFKTAARVRGFQVRPGCLQMIVTASSHWVFMITSLCNAV